MKDKGRLNSGLMFAAGIILVVIAALTFVTTSWGVMSGGSKVGVMFILSLVLTASSYMAKRYELNNTSVAVYTVGIAFATVTVLGCGWFGLFGDYARIGKDGDMIIYAASALVLCIGAVAGALWHKHRFYSLIGWISLSVLYVCLLISVKRLTGFDSTIFNIMLGVYSVGVMLMQRLVNKLPYPTLKEPYRIFMLINTVVMGATALAFARDFVTMAIFTVCMLKTADGGKQEYAGGIAAGVFMFMAVFYLTSPNKPGDYVFTLAAFTLASSLLSYDGDKRLLGEITAKVMSFISTASVVVAMAVCCYELTSNRSISNQVGIGILLINNVLMLKGGNKRVKYIQPFIAMLFGFGLVGLLYDYVKLSDEILLIIFGGIATLYFVLTVFWNRARCAISDMVVLGCVALCACVVSDYGSMLGLIPLCAYCVATIYVLLEDKYKFSNITLSVLLPIAAAVCIHDSYDSLSLAAYIGLIVLECVGVCVIGLIGDRRFKVLKTALLVAVSPECLIALLSKEIRIAAVVTVTLTYSYITYAHREHKEWVTPAMAVLFGKLTVFAAIWQEMGVKSLNMTVGELAMLVPIGAMVIAELWGESGRRLFKGSMVIYTTGLVAMLALSDNIDTMCFIFAIAICTLGYALMCRRGFSIFACIPLIAAMVFIVLHSIGMSKYTIVVYTYICFIGINIVGGIFADKQRLVYTDYSGITGVLMLLAETSDTLDPFWGFMLAALLALLTAVRRDRESIKKRLIAIAIGCAAMALITQELLSFPDIIATEYKVGVTLAAVAGMRRLWRESRAWSVVMYVACILGILVLFADAVITSKIADGIIIGCIGLSVMLTGFTLKRRKWYLLGGITLIFVSIYMSKDFWLSLGWWSYLMLAGILLIGAACVNEWRRSRK